MLNVIAILLFLLSNVRAAIIGARGEGRTKGK
jgi:hypothetical protein